MTHRPWRLAFSHRLHRPIRRPVRGRGTAAPLPHPALLTLAVALLVFWGITSFLIQKLRPAVGEIAAAQAHNAMTAVIEQAVTADLAARQVSYATFVDIQRDSGGAITALTTDMAQLNLLRAELTSVILDALEGVDVSTIQVPLGSLFDFEPLWARGPALKVRSMAVGTVSAEFDSELSSAGVNQTVHRIWIEVDVPMTLLLPGGEIEIDLHTRLRVAETVIVGRVPDTYLSLERGADE